MNLFNHQLQKLAETFLHKIKIKETKIKTVKKTMKTNKLLLFSFKQVSFTEINIHFRKQPETKSARTSKNIKNGLVCYLRRLLTQTRPLLIHQQKLISNYHPERIIPTRSQRLVPLILVIVTIGKTQLKDSLKQGF